MRDAIENTEYDRVFPIVWSRQDDEQLREQDTKIMPLFEVLGEVLGEEIKELPVILYLGQNSVATYTGPIDDPSKISADLLSAYTE